MPGTLGAFFGSIVFLVFYNSPVWSELNFALYTVVISLYAIWLGGKAEFAWGVKDPYQFVMDEVAGVAYAFLFVGLWIPPEDWFAPFVIAGAGFLIFRYFDIAKPGVIKKVEKYPGGLGINFDDFLSGVFTGIILHAGCFVWYGLIRA